MRRITTALLLFSLCAAGCTTFYYKTMQKLGREKRDILVSRVKDSKKDQEQAKEQIKTTMETSRN
jgi:dethiobiotin synthetase